MKELLAGIIATVLSVFGGHQAVIHSASNAAAAASVAPSAIVATSSAQNPASVFAPPTIINQPVIERIVERTVQTAAPPAGYVSETEFTTRLNELSDRFGRIISGSTYPAPASTFASGGIWNAVALTNRIDHLSGTNLSNITVDGVSGLTNEDIPDDVTASNYLPLSGGSLTFASSTLFSVFNGAYFGASATSSFDSAGALTLATPLLVSSGGTGANTFGQGWIYSLGGTGALAASTSPTVNYITATSTTATSTFAGSVVFAASGGNSRVGIGVANSNYNLTVSGNALFTGMPEIHSISGDATPIYGRTSTDGKTVGAWNIVDDSIAGDLFHVTTEANKGSNVNGAVFAVGIQYGGKAYFVNNYGSAGSGNPTTGFVVSNLSSIDNASSYGFLGSQSSELSPLMRLSASRADAATLLQFVATAQTMNAGTKLATFDVNAVGGSTLAGQILADTGLIDWRRTIQSVAPNSSVTPLIRVADEATNPTETYIGAKTNAETGLHIYRWSGSTNLMYSSGLFATTDRLKLQVGNGPQVKGAETMSTLIEARVLATPQMGFFGATPVSQPVNTTDLRTAIINLGLLASGGATPLNLNGGALTAGSNGLIIGTSQLVVSGGNVGIGTTTPWRKLSVTGTVGFDGLTGSTGAGSVCLSADKEIVYNSGSDSCLSSTRATKHDITPLDLSALDMVTSLQPVSFVYNNDASSTVRYGFIAEDAAAVDAHLATYDAQGAISGIDDRSVIALTVRAVQSLISTISEFADRFTTRELTFTRASGDEITVRKANIQQANVQELCVGSTCLTESQVQALLNQAGQQPSAPSETPPASEPEEPQADESIPEVSDAPEEIPATEPAAQASESEEPDSSIPEASDAPPTVPADTPEDIPVTEPVDPAAQ